MDANFKESEVPDYILPNPLICLDGTKILDETQWFKKRRSEILEFFESQIYGRMPGEP